MSKAAVDANRIKELEEVVAEMNLTIQAQSETIVDQMNRELILRRDITALRAALNGAPKEVKT